jgi:membrane fusion protein (multidrug efflux system)
MNAVAEKPQPAAEVPASPAPTHAAAPHPTSPASRRRSLKTPLRAGAALLVLAAALLVGNWWLVEGIYLESTDNAYIQGDIAVLSPRIEGTVQAIPVRDNQFVRKGDPLIVLDPSDSRARLDQALAARQQAEAALATARSQVDASKATIQQMQAMVAQAEAENVRAAGDAVRAHALVGAGWTSRQSDDQALADARKAVAALAASSAQLAASRQAEQTAETQVAQAAAQHANADAAVTLARNNLDYTVIRAPFDGIAGNRSAELGQHVMAGQQLIALAPPPRDLYILANFKETQLGRMHQGDPVSFTADIKGGVTLHGHVDSLAPATGALFSLLPPENATGNFTKIVQRVPVKIVIDPADADHAPWLRAGLSVEPEVDTRGPGAVRLGIIGAALHTLGLR